MASKKMRLKEFEKYPKYYNYYIKAFELMLENRENNKKNTTWKNAKEVMKWWIN